MLVKVSELSGVQLDWAVARAEGVFVQISNGGWWLFDSDAFLEFRNDYNDSKLQAFRPSTDWAQGGPIIGREKLHLAYYGDNEWGAFRWKTYLIEGYEHEPQNGTTPLIAAMRCYVAIKLSGEIEVPNKLMEA